MRPLKTQFFISILLLFCLFSCGNTAAYALSSDGLYWSESIRIYTTPDTYSYEGHTIRIRDESNYMIPYDGLNHIPVEVAEDGYIKTRWEGDFRTLKINEEESGCIIDMLACFDVPDTYDITLYSTWQKGGEQGNTNIATKNLDIRSCPAIDKSNFEGERRAFQRQKLSFRLAQNPYYPIDRKSLSVTIKDSSGQIVPYCKDLEIQTEASNEFVNVSLEFVTKNTDEEIFTYTVYARDSRWKILNVTKEFTVKKDLTPIASIKIPLRLYRNASGVAIANAIYNGGKTDDPIIIDWDLPSEAIEPAYSDDKGMVSFYLDKLGNYQIGITLTDIWIDTIDEFTAGDARKSSSYTVNFKVDNMAPYLEEDDSMRDLDLLLINSNTANEEEIREALLEYNVNLNLFQVELDKDEPKGELSQLGSVSITARSDLDNTVYFESAHLLDNEYYYRLVGLSSSVSLAETLYIYRYDLNDLSANPITVQIPSTAFPSIAKNTVVSLSSDLQEKNIYLNVGNECLAMNKKTRSFYPKFSKALGKAAFTIGDYVYSLCSDGFYSFNLSTGDASLINDYQSINILDCPSRLIFGQAHFCAEKDGAIYQCIFDLSTKAFSANKLFESAGTTYLLSISPVGNMYFETNDKTTSTLKSYTRNRDELYSPLVLTRNSIFANNSKRFCHPVYDRFGEINYIYNAYHGTANYKNASIIYLRHLKTQSCTEMRCGVTTPDLSKNVMGLQLGDGTVLAGLATKYDNPYTTKNNTGVLKQLDSSGTVVSLSYSFPNRTEFQCRNDDYIALSYTKSDTNVITIYKFTEGFDARAQKTSLETLSNTSNYKYMTEILDIDSIIQNNHITKPGVNDVSIYREVGDIVTLSDFGFSKDYYLDYEEDYPLREKTTITFPFTCTKKGRYVFYFSVLDTTGTSFDKESKKQIGVIYVDSDEDDYDEPIEKPEQGSGLKSYILHRRY